MALHGGRQLGDPMVVGGGGGGGGYSSSIALLQERFRQLEKMREKREEMEVLKLFSESEKKSKRKHYERLVHPEMKARSSFQESLSLGLDLFGKKTEHQASKTPPFRDFWSMDSVTVSTSRVHEKPDVDTSLHL